MLACWIAAFAIALAGLVLLARPAQLPRPGFDAVEVAVIGTSLVHRAIPATGKPGELLPGRGAHFRIGLAAPSREEILLLVEQASEAGVGTVLIEANPLIFTLSGHTANLHCNSLSCRVRYRVAQERRKLAAGARALLGMPSADEIRLINALGEPVERQWAYSTGPMRGESFTFHELDNADIVETIARTKARGVEIILLLPPRSPSAELLLPEGQAQELASRAEALSEELDVPLFAPHEGWSDADFVDRAHMSRQGRERFLRELREWWVRFE